MNRGTEDFSGRSTVDVGVAFRFIDSQDAEDHKTDAHSMIGPSRIAWSGKESKDLIASLPKPGSINLRIGDKAQFMFKPSSSSADHAFLLAGRSTF
ncbi:hypothetical protein YTPLAS72_08090 [Nitrospira sp.]|nr:hypothetical protein YTPLAS72_08090 [Nitrospira sp.]